MQTTKEADRDVKQNLENESDKLIPVALGKTNAIDLLAFTEQEMKPIKPSDATEEIPIETIPFNFFSAENLWLEHAKMAEQNYFKSGLSPSANALFDKFKQDFYNHSKLRDPARWKIHVSKLSMKDVILLFPAISQFLLNKFPLPADGETKTNGCVGWNWVADGNFHSLFSNLVTDRDKYGSFIEFDWGSWSIFWNPGPKNAQPGSGIVKTHAKKNPILFIDAPEELKNLDGPNKFVMFQMYEIARHQTGQARRKGELIEEQADRVFLESLPIASAFAIYKSIIDATSSPSRFEQAMKLFKTDTDLCFINGNYKKRKESIRTIFELAKSKKISFASLEIFYDQVVDKVAENWNIKYSVGI